MDGGDRRKSHNGAPVAPARADREHGEKVHVDVDLVAMAAECVDHQGNQSRHCHRRRDPRHRTGPVAVFAAPWSANAAEIVARAGGQLVAAGRSPQIIMAISADDDFVRRLYQAGAILVTDPKYAIGCDVAPMQGESQ